MDDIIDRGFINVDDLYLIIMFLVILLSLTVRYLMVLRSHLKSIMIAADSVSKGDFSVELDSDATGELGRLAYNFNYMVKKIKNNIVELEDKNIKLKAILKSISNGIIAIDNRENVMLMNQKAQKLFSYEDDDFEQKNFEKVVKEEPFFAAIKEVIGYGKRKKIVVEDEHGNYYKIKSDPIKLHDEKDLTIGAIINIEDITQRKRLEKIRSDFVANVTHELKTPLTSISGFVETLKGNENIDIAVRNRFLDSIDMETDRLRSLIDDILTLSFIESNENKKGESFKWVNVWDVYKEVFDMISPFAQKKGIQISERFENKEITILSNPDYIKQLLLNLIDNAVKYTPEKGNVIVTVEENEKHINIKVKDSGIGIPQEDIPRIFERFYRVEKARSRKIGGTGLGLAIVKHIVLSLNGKIHVESKLNEGSEFIIDIEKPQ